MKLDKYTNQPVLDNQGKPIPLLENIEDRLDAVITAAGHANIPYPPSFINFNRGNLLLGSQIGGAQNFIFNTALRDTCKIDSPSQIIKKVLAKNGLIPAAKVFIKKQLGRDLVQCHSDHSEAAPVKRSIFSPFRMILDKIGANSGSSTPKRGF